jgi:dihydrofolate reductase
MGLKIKLIIAVDRNGVMGDKNTLPWKLSDDLKQFKKETVGSPLIMGSNTFKSLPGILPGREHLVLSTTMYGDKDKSVFTSIKNALDYLNESECKKVFVIGGANVVKQFAAMNLFDELIITHVDCSIKGDTILDLDEDLGLENWHMYKTEGYEKSDKNEYGFIVNRYIKKKKRFY